MNCILLTFLFFTSFTMPVDKADNESLHDIDQQFIEIFGDKALSSFKTKEDIPVIDLSIKERILCLVKDHWKKLTEEQLIFLFELAFKLDHPRLLEKLYDKGGKLKGMDTLILKKGSQKLKFYFFYDVLVPFTTYYHFKESPIRSAILNEYEWKKAVGFYDPFENIAIPGPLFSNFAKDSSSKTRLYAHRQNFEGLLPDIADYVAQEYQQGRIVFFHGQHSIWMFLEKIYRRLYEMVYHKKFPEGFISLRFKLHSSLMEENLAHIKALGCPYQYHSLLFVNIHLDAGRTGQNSLIYATENFDQTNRGNRINIDPFISDIFKEHGLKTIYQKLSELHPDLFTELKKTYDDAIVEQGNYGRLLVISMPRKLAQKLSYSADIHGGQHILETNDWWSSDTLTIADNFNDQIPTDNPFALILTEELINPEAAVRAGVKIVGFDPAFYWQTEKALIFERKLDELIKLIHTMKS